MAIRAMKCRPRTGYAGKYPHQQLPEFTQTHVHWVRDAIQPSCPLLSLSPAFSISQHQGLPMNQLFASGGQSIGASASVLPMNIQDWFRLGLTGLILQSKGLSRVFSQHHNSKVSILICAQVISFLIAALSLPKKISNGRLIITSSVLKINK